MSGDAGGQLYRGYDVRGSTDVDLTPAVAAEMAAAFGAIVREGGGSRRVYVGDDGRPSGSGLSRAVVAALVRNGVEVIELGVVPTPVVYFASASDAGSYGLAVTASHLPVEWNGLKFCRGSHPIHTDLIRERVEQGVGDGDAPLPGRRHDGRREVLDAYFAQLLEVAGDLTTGAGVAAGSRLRVVLDAQNAAASEIGPAALSALGVELTTIHVDRAAGYPFRSPDPQVRANLIPLGAAVVAAGADLGVAFDGDADRLGVVDARGERVAADSLLALFARDVAARIHGARVVHDVLCSPVVGDVVREAGGEPIEAPSGHAFVQDRIREVGAVLGGEGSGHIFFADRYRGPALGYDDALYAAVRLIELVARRGPLAGLVAGLPTVFGGEEWRPVCPDDRKREIVADVEAALRAEGHPVSTIDGVKVIHGPLSWVLVRAANTEPALSVRAVAADAAELKSLEEGIVGLVQRVADRHGVLLAAPRAS